MGILSTAWKGVKFAASATIGIPCAMAATACVGTAYLLAEATNIVEAKVFHPHGFKLVHKNPFFEGVSNSLYGTLQSVWKDYGAYSHIAVAKWAFQKRKRHFDFSDETPEKAEIPESESNPERTPIEYISEQTLKQTKDKAALYFDPNQIPNETVQNPIHSKLFPETKDKSRE